MTDEQFAKLPKFAQQEINSLRRRLDEAHAERRRIIPGRSTASKIVVGHAHEPGAGFSFSTHEPVAFRLSDEDAGNMFGSHDAFGWVHAERDEYHGVPFLKLRGVDHLIVMPRVTNEIWILQAPGHKAEIPARFW